MDKKEDFKVFVKQHPKLITYVKDGKMTWQKFFEIYDLYGEDDNIWKEYLTPAVSTLAASDLLSFIKNINIDEFQNGISSVQRVLGVLGDLTNKNKNTTNTYKPRPIYKHFDD